jgi:hypothetical protein
MQFKLHDKFEWRPQKPSSIWIHHTHNWKSCLSIHLLHVLKMKQMTYNCAFTLNTVWKNAKSCRIHYLVSGWQQWCSFHLQWTLAKGQITFYHFWISEAQITGLPSWKWNITLFPMRQILASAVKNEDLAAGNFSTTYWPPRLPWLETGMLNCSEGFSFNRETQIIK